MVRAKFVCESKQDVPGSGAQITLRPVYSGSEENKEFFKYTPAGQVQLSVVNEKAADQFEIGKEYYVDFTPAN